MKRHWVILILLMATSMVASAQFVFTNLPLAYGIPFQSMGCSTNAKIILACGALGTAYTSRDGGQTWTNSGLPDGEYYSCFISADGSNMLAAADNLGQPFQSTNAGQTWTQLTNNSLPSFPFATVVGSTNGQNLLVADYGTFVYRSTNSGKTWSVGGSAPSGYGNYFWQCGACSGDGTRVVLANTGSGMMLSPDLGSHWYTNAAPTSNWTSITCNPAGNLWLAGDQGDGTIVNGSFVGGALWISSDYGTNWAMITNSPLGGWQGVAMTPDGKEMAAANRFAGAVSISIDGGSTWKTAPIATNLNWDAVAFSSDGVQILAAPYRQPIALGTWAATLGISLSNSAARLSWLAPSNGYLLQKSSALASNGWQDVGSNVNYNTYTNAVSLTVGTQLQFFRLRRP